MVVPRLLLPFDAHNHIQLGPPPPTPLLAVSPRQDHRHKDHQNENENEKLNNNNISNDNDNNSPPTDFFVRSLGEYIRQELKGKHLSGMALMATHPRDFSTLLDLEREFRISNENCTEKKSSNEDEITVLPCLGVHPWFLHELDPLDDWTMVPSSSSIYPSPCQQQQQQHHHHHHQQQQQQHQECSEAPLATVPRWIANLESMLMDHPHLPVGEIGLDNFHFDPVTEQLTTPMDQQVEAFKLQLGVATKFHRPVSLHCVRAMGKIMETFEEVAEENYKKLSEEWNSSNSNNIHCNVNDNIHILPPRLYFHAFGGKAATATQLIKTLEKPRRIKIRNDAFRRQTRKKFVCINPPKIYFGFAPPVNFKSPKTASVIKAVGLERLVLETDREDVQKIGPDMEAGIEWISEVLGISKEELVSETNNNVDDLYGCCGRD